MMNKRFWQQNKLIAVSLVLSFLLLTLTGCTKNEGTHDGQRVEFVSTHPSFVTQQELSAILAGKLEKSEVPKGRIVSAVMPHHLVAGQLLADAMETLAQQEPDLVIIVGPNHSNQGGKIITGLSGWQTPEGIVYTEENAVNKLLNEGPAVRDEKVLSKEHSIGALVPLLKHFIPEAKIVPVVLHHDVSLQEVDAILNVLEPYLQEKAILISSVDFSHYLTRGEAQVKDKETLSYMENFDYVTLFHLGNDYLDSPISLAAAFRLAEKHKIKEFSLLNNTNSGILLQNDFIETTSYFTLLFTKIE